MDIDREDNDGDYNPENCRFITRRENNLNKRVYRTNKSGFTGVSWDRKRGKWRVEFYIGGRTKLLGAFSSRVKAALTRDWYIITNNLLHEYEMQVAQ